MLTLGQLEREELHVLLLNAKNRVLRDVTVYVGNVSASLVRISELFTEAIRENASGVILVHNHPSGDPTPSPDDLHLTAEALAAGRLLDIDVLDHIVVAREARRRSVTGASPSTGSSDEGVPSHADDHRGAQLGGDVRNGSPEPWPNTPSSRTTGSRSSRSSSRSDISRSLTRTPSRG